MALKQHKKRRRYPFKRNLTRKLRRILFMVIIAILASGINFYKTHQANKTSSSIESNPPFFTAEQQVIAVNKIRNAKNNSNAQFWVGFNGKIVQILKDDTQGSRHQKFLISPNNDITLLVAHNIDLVQRVPISKGDSISLFGRYEWNHRGGVMHWTHHDPAGKKKGGWIKAHGKTYR